ncbi:MAG: hypothetical protein PHR51_01295 [Patescibacteria group bacterium]|nr:hypothetical protein [Patescibacteria group bacterium]
MSIRSLWILVAVAVICSILQFVNPDGKPFLEYVGVVPQDSVYISTDMARNGFTAQRTDDGQVEIIAVYDK